MCNQDFNLDLDYRMTKRKRPAAVSKSAAARKRSKDKKDSGAMPGTMGVVQAMALEAASGAPTVAARQDKMRTPKAVDGEVCEYDTCSDEDEFKCERCDTVQGLNNCELCDAENVCEVCYGEGGDYGPNEVWVCNNCLPTCNACRKQLYSAVDECCGKGRSDLNEDKSDE